MLGLYRLLSAAAYRLPYPPGVLRRSIVGRTGAAARWAAWGAAQRGDGPLLWAHAASIGEQQVLEPVLARLRRARPDLRMIVSHTSPSVPRTQIPDPVCHRDYLPADRTADVRLVFDAVRPDVLVFGRGDLWPVFADEGARRGVPIAIAGAVVRPASRRLGRIGRSLLGSVHRSVGWVGAVTGADAERWQRLGVPATAIAVTGDPRHDRILERVADVRPARALRAWAGAAPILMAASVEPADDDVLAEALAVLAGQRPTVRAVLVPHDPTPARIAQLEQRLAAHTRGGRWSGCASDPIEAAAHTVIVTTVGRLADLLLGADAAYVGGGFRPGTLHAVAEPAAVGLPVAIGPQWRGAADAGAMVRAAGARVVGSGAELAAEVTRLADDPPARRSQGLAARGVLREGAAQASTAALLELLPPAR